MRTATVALVACGFIVLSAAADEPSKVKVQGPSWRRLQWDVPTTPFIAGQGLAESLQKLEKAGATTHCVGIAGKELAKLEAQIAELKGKADAETELQAIQKELAKLEAQIAVLKKKAGPLRVKVAEAKMARAVDEVIQEARGQYSRNPKRALELLREMLAEVWDNPQITEGARDALLIRLVTARGELA